MQTEQLLLANGTHEDSQIVKQDRVSNSSTSLLYFSSINCTTSKSECKLRNSAVDSSAVGERLSIWLSSTATTLMNVKKSSLIAWPFEVVQSCNWVNNTWSIRLLPLEKYCDDERMKADSDRLVSLKQTSASEEANESFPHEGSLKVFSKS